MDAIAVDRHFQERKHGFTSWLKAKLWMKKESPAPVDAAFLADISEITHVARYEITRKLGQGSMGMVYQGKDPYIKRDVAIKISRPSRDLPGEKADKYRERFFIEAQSAGRLTHPNIVAIYDAGMFEDFCYITMEYIDGSTLQSFCDKDNLLPLTRVGEMVFKACKALEYAHKMGVIHRDIKPSNIMLTKSDGVRITDFGIAHIETEGSPQKGIVGSPSYMSPEQVKEQPIEETSDIFSLGCVLYELLTGEKAFPGDNYFSILYKITHEEPVPLRSVRGDIPEVFDRIMRKAIAKDPSKRYQTCMDFAYDLRVALRRLKGTIRRSKLEDVLDYIHQVTFFEDFTRDQVGEILNASNLVKVLRGKVVVSEGEIDDSFFVILSGKAAVQKHNKTLAMINRGECFGEMSYLSGQSRAATVVAASDCILMKISATLLDRASEGMQLLFLRRFAETLMSRLSNSNRQKP